MCSRRRTLRRRRTPARTEAGGRRVDRGRRAEPARVRRRGRRSADRLRPRSSQARPATPGEHEPGSASDLEEASSRREITAEGPDDQPVATAKPEAAGLSPRKRRKPARVESLIACRERGREREELVSLRRLAALQARPVVRVEAPTAGEAELQVANEAAASSTTSVTAFTTRSTCVSVMPTQSGRRTSRSLADCVICRSPCARPYLSPAGDECRGT